MEKAPLISIVTVTYNAAKTIKKTIESLRKQSWEDFEHLIIDGASKDKTLEIVKEALLPQTKILSEPDNGLYDAMNKGLRLAKGQYILFLNAGDTFHSSDTLCDYAKKALEEKDIIYGDTIIVNEAGEKISNRHLSVPSCLTKKSFSNGMLICHQAFMVKRELAPLYDLSYRFSADYDWCVKCIEKTDPKLCCNLQKITIDYLSEGLTDKNKWASLRERFQIMSRHYGTVPTIFKHIKFIGRSLKRGTI